MGLVNFDTTVQKNVNLDKAVDLDVDKLVFSNANVQGRLATSEASADSTGGGEGGPGEITTRSFLIDDFDEFQEVIVTGQADTLANPNPNIGTAPGPDVGARGGEIDPALPDAADFPPEDTDIPQNALRTISVRNIDTGGDSPGPSEGSGIVTGDPTLTEPGTGRLNLDTGENTLSLDDAFYQADIDGDGEFRELEDDAFSIIVDCPPEFFDLTNQENRIVLEDVNLGGVEEGETLRFEASVTDSDGDTATVSAYATDDFVDGTAIEIPLGLFSTSGFAAPPGTEFVQGFFAVGQQRADINFTEVVELDFRILGNPQDPDAETPFPGLSPAVSGAPGENPTTNAFDVSFDDFRVETICQRPGQGGNLAETDTFAQVDDFGAFSFSESLAASSAEADVLIA